MSQDVLRSPGRVLASIRLMASLDKSSDVACVHPHRAQRAASTLDPLTDAIALNVKQ
jgi:hypothetical protein